MPLPNEVLQIVLEYVAEVQHSNDPWLWRVRLVSCQFYDLANDLIWKTLTVAPSVFRLPADLSEDTKKDISRAVKHFIDHGTYEREQEDETPLRMEDLVKSVNPKLSFEIIHNAWTAYTFRDPVFYPLFHDSEIDKSALVKLSNALCSEFRGYVSCFYGSHYSTDVTESRVKDQTTFDILKRHAHRVRKLGHVRPVSSDGSLHGIDFFLSTSATIAENCKNLQRIQVSAEDMNSLKLLNPLVGHPNISSVVIDIFPFTFTDDEEFLIGLDSKLLTNLVSTMKNFESHPKLEVSIWSNNAISSEWLRPVLDHSLKVTTFSMFAPEETILRLDLPPTTEDFEIYYNEAWSLSGPFTMTGPTVTDLSIWGTSSDAEPEMDLTRLRLDFPRLASLKITYALKNKNETIDRSALKTNFRFGRLKHMKLHQSNINHIAELIDYFRPSDSVEFGSDFLASVLSIDNRDYTRKIVANIPPKITIGYAEGIWGVAQILSSYRQVTQVFVTSDGEGEIWKDDEVDKWLEIWPGDRGIAYQSHKVRKGELDSVDFEGAIASLWRYQETV